MNGSVSSDCIMGHQAAQVCQLRVLCKAQESYTIGGIENGVAHFIGMAEVTSPLMM